MSGEFGLRSRSDFTVPPPSSQCAWADRCGARRALELYQRSGEDSVTDRLAIKRLTPSDCTLFEGVFRTINAGNQKSINLNADVLIGQLYPGLAASAAATDNEIALAISIYGPDAKGAHNLSRKIIKNTSYKNWRLDGEFIPGPPGDTSRYDGIQPGDLAIMAFKGDPSPSGMDLIVVSKSNPADATLHAALMTLFGNRSMIAATPVQIAAAATGADVPETHPIYIAAADPEMDAALEDAAQGGIEGTGKLLQNKSSRKISGTDLAKTKAKAEFIGLDGEGLINSYLAARIAAGDVVSYTWASDANAIAPFDFETLTAAGQRTLIDVKSTTGPFDNVIHLSIAEIIEASGEVPYRVYRVFELNEDGGKLRISDDIRPLAQKLKAIHEAHMPDGIRVDGLSVDVSVLTWSAEEYVERPEEEVSDG